MLARVARRRARRRRRDARERALRAGRDEERPRARAALAALADVYVNDAFGAAHRAHASTEAVAHLLPSAAGRLLEREVRRCDGILADPERPLVAVVGGAKVTDKIGVLDAFLRARRPVLIGGAMCFPFFKAQGHEVGASLCEEEGVEPGPARARRRGGEKLRLPSDLVAGREFAADAETQRLDGVDVPDGWMGLDIGPRTRRGYAEVIARRRDGVLERPDGRLRARAVRGGHAHRGRGGGRGRRPRPWSAAATPPPRWRSSGWPTASTTSRPAAAPRSS